jgi:tRNA-dihydrouridine synthase
MKHESLILAPLRGVTMRTFREVWARHFTGLDTAVSPFVPLVAGDRVKPGLLADVDPALPQGIPVVPQVIGRDPQLLRVMIAALQDKGHARVDLNAGCPWPMVVRKGRGAGLMAREDDFRRMLEAGCDALPRGFSVKVRLGVDTPDLLLRRMPVINAAPLCEVVIHARTARQMYEGTVDIARFGEACEACIHPVIYNGDIRTAADLARLRTRFPRVTRWMIGRGVAADPFLPERLRSGSDAGAPRDLARFRAYLDDLLEVNRAVLFGEKPVLGRFKELWYYLSQTLTEGPQTLKRIQHSATLDDYRRAVDGWFARAPGWMPERDGIEGSILNQETR